MYKKSTGQKRQAEVRRKKGWVIDERLSHWLSDLSRTFLSPRRRSRSAKKDGNLPWVVGFPIIMVIIVSFVSSLWFGWQINKKHGELSRNRQGFIVAAKMNSELLATRDRLLAEESITRKAAVLGLFPPNEKQIRKIKP